MEFSGQYLTYAEYIALGGVTLDNPSFNLLEFQARKIIDGRTLNRLVGGENIPQAVKICEYNMINSIKGYAQTMDSTIANGNVASENTDGYSISYITQDKISEIVKAKNDELGDIVDTYLMYEMYNNEHLLYIGV